MKYGLQTQQTMTYGYVLKPDIIFARIIKHSIYFILTQRTLPAKFFLNLIFSTFKYEWSKKLNVKFNRGERTCLLSFFLRLIQNSAFIYLSPHFFGKHLSYRAALHLNICAVIDRGLLISVTFLSACHKYHVFSHTN